MLEAVEAEFTIAYAALGRGPILQQAAVDRERRFRRTIEAIPDQEVDTLCALTDAQLEEFFRRHARTVVAQDLPS
jgi:hypothetical protein